MSNVITNYYQSCRKNAGLTQEAAADQLSVAVRTLSDYENGHADVPDDVVERMIEVYKAPMLAWWHMKHYSLLGKYLPDIVVPESVYDMGFFGILAEDDLNRANAISKKILDDGVITPNEMPETQRFKELASKVSSRVMSVLMYANSEL